LHGQNIPPDSQQPQLFDGYFMKLLGKNTAFTAMLQKLTATPDVAETIDGNFAFDAGKTRYEVDLTKMVVGGSHGDNPPFSPDEKAQINASGMALMIQISRPDKKLDYVVMPDLKAYLEQPHDFNLASSDSELKTEIVELGKEKVGSYDCVKNKITFTPKSGLPEIFTVWNTSTLNNFPVKIEHVSKNAIFISLTFTDIKLEKPDAAVFELPVDAKKYTDEQTLMREVVTPRINAMPDASKPAPSASSAAPVKGT